MILPSKHLSEDRAMLGVGASILRLLDEPKTASRLWDELKTQRQQESRSVLSYDWFVLALDFLYCLRAVDLDRGRIRRAEP